MRYAIRMGIPEMLALWTDLQQKYRSSSLSKAEEKLYKKWGNALKKLSEDPFYPSFQTHEIAPPLNVMECGYGNRILKIKQVVP